MNERSEYVSVNRVHPLEVEILFTNLDKQDVMLLSAEFQRNVTHLGWVVLSGPEWIMVPVRTWLRARAHRRSIGPGAVGGPNAIDPAGKELVKRIRSLHAGTENYTSPEWQKIEAYATENVMLREVEQAQKSRRR